VPTQAVGVTQAPPVQTCPLAQASPQAPQLLVSFWRFAQKSAVPASEHSVWPEVHSFVHVPDVQTWPCVHWTPHPPQLAVSVCSLAQ
jgi:hypothetical protein